MRGYEGMTGWQTLVNGRLFLPMRGYELNVDLGIGATQALFLPMRGYEGSLQSWHFPTNSSYFSP